MSLLANPSFEMGTADYWKRGNQANAVSFGVERDSNVARSGTHYLRVRTAVAGGSIAQDFRSKGPGVTALAYVRAAGSSVTGQMTLWDLDSNASCSTRFSVGQQWTLLADMLGTHPANERSIRIEFYIDTPNADLLIDSATAF